MKVAVIGSRNIGGIDIGYYIPAKASLIITGGAKGIDTLAEAYADKYGIEKRIFLPDYKSFGRAAPLVRNTQIVDECELLVAVWDGVSRGTNFTIDYAKRVGKRTEIFIV